MIESLKVFKSICNNVWLLKAKIILFFNKLVCSCNLLFGKGCSGSVLCENQLLSFVDMLSRIHWQVFLSKRKLLGPNTLHATSQYIEKKFRSANWRTGAFKETFVHFTCAAEVLDSRFAASLPVFMVTVSFSALCWTLSPRRIFNDVPSSKSSFTVFIPLSFSSNNEFTRGFLFIQFVQVYNACSSPLRLFYSLPFPCIDCDSSKTMSLWRRSNKPSSLSVFRHFCL